MKKNIFNLITGIFLLLMFQQNIIAQTVLIDPAGDGGFSNGSTFAANGWTESSSTNNPWVIGTALSGVPFSGNTAYVSNDGGTTHAYTNTASALNFFYRDITVPAGESKIALTFNWVCNGESTWDLWQVFTAPTSVVPVGTTTYPGSGTSNVPSVIAGATFVGYGNLQTTAQTATLYLPTNLAGTTFRLIFGWKDDTSGGSNPPAGIDNISLVASLPTPLVGGNIYPINGTQNPPISFASITTTLDYLASDGVTGTGQVILELSTGYAGEPGPVSINSIPGASSTLGVTFRPATGYTALTSITGGTSPNQHAIRLNACSYVTLDGRAGGVGSSRDWTIRATGTNGQMAVRLDNTNGSMTGISIRNLFMEGEATNTTGAIFQITGGSTNTISNVLIENNLIRSAATLRGYGITLAVASNVGNTGIVVRNNDITQFYARGINLTGGFPGIEVYGNNIYHASAITQPTATEFAGIYFSTSASTGAKIYNNYIFDIQLTNASTSINGIQLVVSNSTGAIPVFYNNRIDLGAGITTMTIPIYGIHYSTTTATYPYDIHYNSVRISGTTTSGATNSAAFRKAAGNVFNLKNNIFYNNRTNSGGTGTHWGIAVNNTTFTSINNNDYFADGAGGVLGTTDGTTTGNKTTLAAWKVAVPADANSVSQNPNYIAGLKIDTSIPSQLESGGTPITDIITDFEGDPRNATTPDIGADEFTGIALDFNPPTIAYTPLAPTSSITSRTLSSSITDISGVPTAGIGLPVLYWRINSGTWNAATATFISGSNYQFTFGGGVALGDTVKYYVVAQDNATPPNVGAFPIAGAGGFTANPPAAATPPTTPSSYLIVGLPLSGSYTVGTTLFSSITGRNITFEKSVSKVMKEVIVETDAPEVERQKGVEYEDANEVSHTVNGVKRMVEVEEISWIPMENGQVYEGDLFVKKAENPSLDFPEGIDGVYLTITAALADLNLRGVSGATTFLLTDATYPTETFPLVVDVLNENKPTSVNTVTIKPNTGVTAAVSGASPAAQIFKIFNSYVTLDGSNSGGTTRNWTIENTSVTTPQVIVIGSRGTTPITNVTVKNCNIINGVTSSSALVVSDGNAPGTAGWFNNITIQNNSIQKAYIGNYNISVVSPGNGSGLLVSGNDLANVSPNHIALIGVYVQGVDGATVTNNHIGNYTTTYTANITGIWFATGTVNSTISNNTIGPINITTAAPRGIVVTSAVSNANVTVSGNAVDSMLTNYTVQPYGIWVFSTTTGVVIENNIVSNIQNINTGGYGARGIHVSTGMALTNITIRNNVVKHVRATSDASNTYWGIGIGIEGATTGVNVYYNSVNLYDTLVGYSAATIHAAFAVLTSTAGLLDVRDNVFVNTFNNVNSTTDRSYAIYSTAPNTAYTFINYNDYYAAGAAGALGYLGAEITTLAAWQTATGQDANSIAAIPQFVSDIDLRPIDTSPLLNAGTPIGGITTDILGATRSATTPTIGAYEMPVFTPLAGDYTVGLSMFKQFSGLNLTFEQRVRTIEITETIVNPEAAEQIGIYEETTEGTVTLQEPAEEAALVPVAVTRTVEQEYFVPMLNGSEYSGELYYELTPEQKRANPLSGRGVYATITAAKNDAMLKGVSAAVRFLLVDATYPSETFPIVINAIPGASAINTVTILPNTGVTVTITGSVALPIFDLNNTSYIVIDGRQNGVGTTNSLTISNTSTASSSSCVRFINGATFNAVQFANLIAQPSTSTTRSIDFSTSASAPSGNSNNLISNCDVNSGRYCIYFSGTAANPNMNNTIANSKFYDGTFAQFYMVSNASSTTIVDNEFTTSVAQTTANSAISMSASALLGVNNIVGNKFYDLQNTSTSTLRGITGTPGAGSTLNIINNFFSFTQDNGTKTSIYAIQISGSTEHTANIHYNTFNFAGVHTGGTTGVLVSAGLVKSNTGATSVFNAKNNIGKNTRTGGTTGVIHTNFFAGTTAIVGTLDINYNAWYAFGDPGSFHAGWGATVYNDLTAYKAAAAPHEQQTIFKDVNFVSGVDLHLAGLSVGDADLAGLPLAGITDDIDGDLRDLTYPYRGADEVDVKFLPILTPSNLTAIPDTFTVALSWQDNSNNEGGFNIQRKDGDSLSVNPFVTVGTVGTNEVYFVDTGLSPNTMYTYRVFAFNSLGNSGNSNMVTTTTFIPVELTAFTAELSGREILVSWATATELNNRGFDIERKMNGEWEKLGFKEGRGTTTTESSYSFIDKFTYESFVGTITYRLKQMDFDGTYAYSPEVEVEVDLTPKEYTLYQNYPNPFNPATTIKYSLPFESNVRIVVYNILGEMLDVLVDETKQVGFHDFNWNASNLASGIYIYTIEAKSVAGDKNYSSVKKMILMK